LKITEIKNDRDYVENNLIKEVFDLQAEKTQTRRDISIERKRNVKDYQELKGKYKELENIANNHKERLSFLEESHYKNTKIFTFIKYKASRLIKSK